MSHARQIFLEPNRQQCYSESIFHACVFFMASEDKRTIGKSGNEPKSNEAVEGVGEKKMRVTYRNARAGGCAWSRRPLHSYQRHSGSGKRIPERNWQWRDRHNCVRGYQPQLVRSYCSVALPLCDCSAHAPKPPAVKIQWPQAMINCVY